MNPNLNVKSDSYYYARTRTWPSLFSIKRESTVLDVGCGRGTLGEFFKKEYSSKVTGIELIKENYEIAKKVLDHAVLGDFEKVNLEELDAAFDYIVFSDSLEHLLDSKSVLDRIKKMFTSDGALLLSIPNVRNFRVSVPLLFLDRWEYENEGLLDRSHIRFFTKSSITKLLNDCGYVVEEVDYDLPTRSKVGVLNILTFGLLKNILTSHFYIKACLRKY